MFLINITHSKWNFQRISEQIAFNSRLKLEEHMLKVMDRSTHEEHLSQPLQTKNEQFKIAVTFLTGCNGIFKVTKKNGKFHSTASINDDDFNKMTFPPGVCETKKLNNEIKRNIIEEGYFTNSKYPFTINLVSQLLGLL